ncbi:MAG: peptidase S10, partial [Atribacterota bacterium]
VFIDPVGTGYSHAVGDIDPHQFWGVMEDVNSVAEFIRAYLTENGRMLSPVCIAGESYGGTRAAGLVKVLQDNGIYPSGIICVSPVFDFENIQWSSLGDRAIALAIPTYAAAAWYYKKISSRLQGDLEKTLEEVRKWTNDEYVPALWKGNMLSPEVRKKIVDRLVEYTGLSPEYIDRMNLRVTEDDFATELLKDQGRAIGIYDVRVSFPGVYADEDDPSFFILTGPFKTSIADYFQKELQFTTDLVYLSGSGEVYEQWNWQSGRPAPKYAGTVTLGFPDISALLVQAMRRCGFLKVFIASGVYDLECPYESVTYSINHFNLPAERKQNISLHLYSGGHMIYTNPEAHRVLKQDLVDFYRQVLGTKNQ